MQAIARLFLQPTQFLFWSVWVAGRRRWPRPTQGLELCGCFNPPVHDRTDARRGEFYSCPFPPCRLS